MWGGCAQEGEEIQPGFPKTTRSMSAVPWKMRHVFGMYQLFCFSHPVWSLTHPSLLVLLQSHLADGETKAQFEKVVGTELKHRLLSPGSNPSCTAPSTPRYGWGGDTRATVTHLVGTYSVVATGLCIAW